MEGERRELDLSKLRQYGTGPPERRRLLSPRAARNIALGIFAVALVASPWLLLVRGTGGPKPPSPRLTAPSASPSGPSASSSASAQPVFTYRVVSSVCLRLRAEPSTRAAQVGCLQPGTEVRTRGVVREAEGRDWLYVFVPGRGTSAWAAAEFLQRTD